MRRHRRAVVALGAAVVLPGCTAGILGSSEDSTMPVKLGNVDSESHWLAVKVRGDEQSSYVQEFAAYLEAEDAAEMCEPLRADELEGDDFELELRLDDEVRTDRVSRHIASRLSIWVLDDGSITYGTGAP